eukprot:Skav227440  [mRNA]  locus=scaffold2491:3789:6183:+ [translate_table: standard]
MSLAVAKAPVPAAPDDELMEGSGEEASLQPAVPKDPLQRLDQSMDQTHEWTRLRGILEKSSPFVRDSICSALNYEMARSFQNVAQQLKAFQDIVAEMKSMMDSEEAVALDQLMRDIHPSNIRALQREADDINKDTMELRSALQRGDFQALRSRASRIGKKAERFKKKYEKLRPKLHKLKSELDKTADKCAAEARKSEGLIAETEQRKEWWWIILAGINVLVLGCGLVISAGAAGTGAFLLVNLCIKQVSLNSAAAALSAAQAQIGLAGVSGAVRALGLAGAGIADFVSGGLFAISSTPFGAVIAAEASLASIQASIASLSTSLASTVPFLCGGFLLVALALLGYAGRDLFKKMVAKLWAAEIEKHQRTKAAFQHMEQVVRLAAEKLGSVCEKNSELEERMDMVVQVAKELAATAEDAAEAMPEIGEVGALLHHQVERLCSECAQVPQAFEELFSSLRDLEPSLQQIGQMALNPAVAFGTVIATATEDNLPKILFNIFNMEVDQGWTLIPLSLTPFASDCLPRNTYILVPVEEAVRLGVLFAAGPNGNHVIQVENQGQSPRLLRSFRFAGSPVQHTLTGDHPLRVMASGNWIQEPASRLRVGDVVNTSNGCQEIETVNPPRASAEEVFSLDIKDGGEVYVFTPAHIGDGQLSWSGVAVLGSKVGSTGMTQRSHSAPPGWPGDLPSYGSRLCKSNPRCSAACHKFRKQKCEMDRDCSFCHFPHPEQPKRAPRGSKGSRDSASSQSGSGQSITAALE